MEQKWIGVKHALHKEGSIDSKCCIIVPTSRCFCSIVADYINRYSPVQSKSNRFKTEDQLCYDPNGKRIFGESSSGDKDIHCRCSRKRWEMEQNKDDGQR